MKPRILGFKAELTRYIGHCKEIQKPTLRALSLRPVADDAGVWGSLSEYVLVFSASCLHEHQTANLTTSSTAHAFVPCMLEVSFLLSFGSGVLVLGKALL